MHVCAWCHSCVWLVRMWDMARSAIHICDSHMWLIRMFDSFVCATNSGVRGRCTCVPGVIHVRDLFVCGTWRVLGFACVIHMCDSFIYVTHSYLWLSHMCVYSFMCVTCSYVGHAHSEMYVCDSYVWLIHICHSFVFVTHSHVLILQLCNSFVSVIWCIMWCIYVNHMCDSFIAIPLAPLAVRAFLGVACVTWRIHMCDILIHICVWHDSFICVTWLIHICVTWRIHMCGMTHPYMCDMTHSYVWHDSFIYLWHAACMCVTCSFLYVIQNWECLTKIHMAVCVDNRNELITVTCSFHLYICIYVSIFHLWIYIHIYVYAEPGSMSLIQKWACHTHARIMSHI